MTSGDLVPANTPRPTRSAKHSDRLTDRLAVIPELVRLAQLAALPAGVRRLLGHATERRSSERDTRVMRPAVWRIRCEGHGWIREIHDGAPIVTDSEVEAWQWATRSEAEAAAARLPATRVKHWVEPGPPTVRVIHGDPTKLVAERC